ncbi:unnamed protein product [Chilo suppressalis]|uniref:Rab3 GTPase-activating protein catalytic subunit n=1 Tax=Chilo suppressalis TaxID=168631 RepID=A0ABN8BDP7_CHISP|nr:unnamed protein product [Chilo suppressalis]
MLCGTAGAQAKLTDSQISLERRWIASDCVAVRKVGMVGSPKVYLYTVSFDYRTASDGVHEERARAGGWLRTGAAAALAPPTIVDLQPAAAAAAVPAPVNKRFTDRLDEGLRGPPPRVADGAPNARTCLLHQKLQLLNCCIKRVDESVNQAGNSSEEEFYDCSEDDDAEDTLPPWDRPVGRQHRLENAKLKNGSPLYVPQTQDPAPKTEDQLEEDAELMVRLGDDARASELRARMMSASLLSDMEAFKAANPGAELCDFVQWYSPRDWLPDYGGVLGARMLLPGNPWAETWSVARPVPAARQRRLFDETREAQQVLHFFRSRTVSAVGELLLPAILRAGAAKCHEEGAPRGNITVGGVDKRRTFEVAAREIYDAEREACRCLCVRTVFGDGTEGEALDVAGRTRVLSAAGGALPAPARKEFTLRVKDSVGVQTMRAALASDMTIIGAFTERIVCL